MPPATLLRFLASACLGLLTGCGSIVESTPEQSPPASGSEMEGMAYWLPKGSILLDGTWEKDKDCTIKVGTLIEPDTSCWRLTRKINDLFEDNVVLEVDPATGLLKTVGGTSEDRSAQIAATALEVAAKAMTFGVGGAAGASFTAERKPKECPKLRTPFHIKIPADQLKRNYVQCFTIIGPPPAPKEKQKVSGQEEKPPTQEGGSKPPEPPVVTLKFEITRLDKPASAAGKQIGEIVDGKLIVDGIVVRAPAPYEVKITQLEPAETGPDLSGEQIVFLPDPIRIYYLALDRTPFVRNETKIALVNGVVQSVTTTRPSIILGIVGVPKTILSALVPVK